jgi:hypothetical protein
MSAIIWENIMSRYRGVITDNVRMSLTVKVRRSIDLREMADFGDITSEAENLPTAGAAHRAANKGSKGATRDFVNLSTIADQTVVDRQDMGSITDETDGVLRYNDEPYQY